MQPLKYQHQKQVELASRWILCDPVEMHIEIVGAGSVAVTCLMVDIFGGLISCSVPGCAY